MSEPNVTSTDGSIGFERKVDAILRLNAWLLEYGHSKQPPFAEDMRIVLTLAGESIAEHRQEGGQ